MKKDPTQTEDSDSSRALPLVVDLDGTLVASDLLVESAFLLARKKPLHLAFLPAWLSHGRAWLKRGIAGDVMPDVSTLPYHRELLAFLRAEKARGRQIVLATASDERIAREVADELDLFDEVLASNGTTNLGGTRKHDLLVKKYGTRGFDYAGNSGRDLAVWRSARRGILVQPPHGLKRRAAEVTEVQHVFDEHGVDLNLYLGALRPQHWLKNALVLVPLIASHQILDATLVLQAFIAFVAFSLCASSVYLLNDLMDLPSDRRHPHKKDRALASGQMPIHHALVLIPLLLIASAAAGLALSPRFLGVLAVYYLLTLAYSLRLKDLVILDVLVLAVGLTLRVLAGSVAVDIPPSPWLLAFCVFIFFSLALVKRYAELVTIKAQRGSDAKARGYVLLDSELLAALGGASGYLSVLVLALYITTDMARSLYDHHELIWLICLALLYWISYLWLMAHRGRMPDDPLVFAIHDPTSRSIILISLAIAVIAI